ncbi:MAG: hypothetical protein Q8S08_12965, partial [Halomonas sp.]
IAAAGVSCVEINLADIDRFATPVDIEAAIDNTDISTWVFHAQKQRKISALHDSLESDYQALIAQHQADEARKKAQQEKEANEARRKALFKEALWEIGQRLTHQLLNYPLIPRHCLNGNECHQSIKDYDDQRNVAVIALHVPASNLHEQVSIVWSYKQTNRFTHRYHRRLNEPYCAIPIAPLLAHHRPPQNPIPMQVIDAFVAQTVIPALLEPSRWYITPVWFEAYARERRGRKKRHEEAKQAAHQQALEAQALERQRQQHAALTQHLSADIETVERLALRCQRQAVEIDAARDLADLPVPSRWAGVSEHGLTALEYLVHVSPACLDDVLKPLCFPYPHEWAYAEHPDVVKALVVDQIVALLPSETTVSTRRIEFMYTWALDQLAAKDRAKNNGGASTLANEVREVVERIQSRLPHYQGLCAEDPTVMANLQKLQQAMRALVEPDGRPITPSNRHTRRGFVLLLCQDLVRMGMLSPHGPEKGGDRDNVRYGLRGSLA